MDINYASKIPPPPADLVEKLLLMKAFKNTDKIIFKASFVPDIYGGKKERKRLCICTACGEEWYTDWINQGKRYGIYVDYEYPEIYADGEIMNCPFCGERVKLTHSAHIDPVSPYNPSAVIGIFGNIDDKFTITEYRVTKQFHKNGVITYQTDKWNCYIFESDKKCIALKAWYKNMGGGILLRDEWYQLKRCVVNDYAEYYYNSITRELTDGTTMENSRLYEYMQTSSQKWPAVYLRYYQKHHRIETLLQIGLIEQVGWEIHNKESRGYEGISFTWADWKEKSPYKIIGFDRTETILIKTKNVMGKHLELLKKAKEKGVATTAQNIEILTATDWYTLERVINGSNEVIKTLKYLEKQQASWHTLRDYWEMSAQQGIDLTNPVYKYPKNLRAAHDRAVIVHKFAIAEQNKATFKKMGQRLSELAFEKDGICIKIAPSEESLVYEGKMLKHCVGRYGKDHCSGRSIFFVRQSEKPDEPWYTLQVELRTGRQLQLHGYNNDFGREIPQEVKNFVTYWLENIFRPFDVQKMKFKPKHKKTA